MLLHVGATYGESLRFGATWLAGTEPPIRIHKYFRIEFKYFMSPLILRVGQDEMVVVSVNKLGRLGVSMFVSTHHSFTKTNLNVMKWTFHKPH